MASGYQRTITGALLGVLLLAAGPRGAAGAANDPGPGRPPAASVLPLHPSAGRVTLHFDATPENSHLLKTAADGLRAPLSFRFHDRWTLPPAEEIAAIRAAWRPFVEKGIELWNSGVLSRPGRHQAYLERFPDRAQWYYQWLTADTPADGDGTALIALPADAVITADRRFWRVRDTTGILPPEGGVDFDRLHADRCLPEDRWQIEDDGEGGHQLRLAGEAGRRYTVFAPRRIDIPALLPTDFIDESAAELDAFLAAFPEIGYCYWQAVVSMPGYRGDTWADCSPAMQAAFRQRTGLAFDPELVELDPLLWQAWKMFKADVAAEAMAIVSRAVHRHGTAHDYYTGDWTYGGSFDRLAPAGTDYQLIWNSSWDGSWEGDGRAIPDWGWEFTWSRGLAGGFTRRPGHSALVWAWSESRRLGQPDTRESLTRWWWHLAWRGMINDALPDRIMWGFSTAHGRPGPEKWQAIREINQQYRFLYPRLRASERPTVTGLIPWLGTNYYNPSLFGLFTRQGYLWDTPVNWRHIELGALARGELPADARLLILPAEPFMSGLIDAAAAARLREWVAAGNALLVLRSAGYTDIYGRDRGHTPLRELTGIDYRRQPMAAPPAFTRTAAGREHPVTAALPETWSDFVDPEWLVQWDTRNYVPWRRYSLGHPAQWFLMRQEKGREMVRRLLPPWADYPESGARVHRDDVTVLYACPAGTTPLLAIREEGRGRVAYLGREYNLAQDFGRPLLAGLVDWLTDSRRPVAADEPGLDITWRRRDDTLLVLSYNPREDRRLAATVSIRPGTLDPAGRYLVLDHDPVNPVAAGRGPGGSSFLARGDRLAWTAAELAAGYPLALDSWRLGLQKIIPWTGQPVVLDHAFAAGGETAPLHGFATYGIRFRGLETGPAANGRLHLELLDPRPTVMPLDYQPGAVEFPPERVEIRVPPDARLHVHADDGPVAALEQGRLTMSDNRWRGRYDARRRLLYLVYMPDWERRGRRPLAD